MAFLPTMDPNPTDGVRDGARDRVSAATSGRVLSSLVASAVHYALAQGVTREEISVRTGIRCADLLDPEARLSDELTVEIWSLIGSLHRARPLALHMARATTFAFFGPWVYPMRFAADLRTVIDTMVRYRTVLADRLELVVREEDEETRVTATHPADELDDGLTHELALGVLWRFLDEILGCREAAARIELPRAPDDQQADEFVAFFDVPVLFGQKNYSVVFRTAKLDLPTREADPALYRYACEHLELLSVRWDLATAPDPLAPVRIAVQKAVDLGAVSLDAVAEEIRMSPRSLQRFVRSHDATVRELIDEARAERARRLLDRSELDLEEVAQRMGYSDDRSFRRAFRRWAGVSPIEYRRGGLGAS